MDCDRFCQEFINSIADPIMIIEHGCRVAMVNDALLSLHGEAREDVLGLPCYKVLHHNDMPCHMPHGDCPFIEVFEAGRPVRVVHRHYKKNREEMIVEITACPVKSVDGKVSRMLEVIRDVTVEQRLQEENRQSLEFLAGVLEGIGEGVVVVDKDFRILLANKGYLQQAGMRRDQLIGRHCYKASHHFDSHCMDNGHDCPVKDVFDTGQPAHAMHTHFSHDGKEVYVECRAYPIKDSSGRVIRAIETLNDVTDRVRLEVQVRESEEKYRDLYDNAPDGYYSLDENGTIVEMNRTLLTMLGYERSEIVGNKRIKEILTVESAELCSRLFPKFKRGLSIQDLELTMIRKDGSLLPVTMSATTVFDKSGRFVMSRSMVRDITEKKRVDEEKKRLQEQLFQSQKLEALGTLAGGIAHDFNNLLASIMGYASIAKMELGEAHPAYRHVDIIETASVRASELTQQLLAFARGGKFDARLNDVNVIVREVSALLSRTIDKSIEMELDMAYDLRPAICDAGQVQQALLNICINARDAMPSGGKLVLSTKNTALYADDVKAMFDVSPGDYVQISVSDTGIGMDKDTQEHIFDPFFTTKEKGTGLGLSLVYGIIKKHGGFIQVWSEPGKGTEFRLYLPACVAGDACSEVEKSTEFRRGAETVLVVDDEPMIRDLVKEILERQGYSVLTAASGVEAVSIYQQNAGRIGLVLLDMVMPHMNGREVFQRLRDINPGVRIVVSSGYSHDRDADYLLEQGAVGFVQKPYRRPDLLRAVEEVMDKYKQK